MTSNEVRKKYIDFFVKRGHVEIPPAPLVLENDPTTLFTSSGMQPLVPYLMGEPHPKGKRLVNSQPSVRAHGKNDDMLEVGDNRHLTVFEMLGNWSLGDYFKEEQLPWFLEYLTKQLGLSRASLWVSIFEGYKNIPKDIVSFEIWKKLGIAENRILYYDVKKNWWSRSGTPDEMPTNEIGGPTSEVFFDFGENLGIHEKSPFKVDKCHPNCDCGRFLEIGNSVFMQYIKTKDGSLKELPQKNVDFGGGLERQAAAVNNDPDTFKTDLFFSLISIIAKNVGEDYDKSGNKNAYRIIADHLKASTFLAVNGVVPSNKEHGYILRRLLRRAIVKTHLLNSEIDPVPMFWQLAQETTEIYDDVYMDSKKDGKIVGEIFKDEVEKFNRSLDRGLKIINTKEKIGAKEAFDLYQSQGFPLELIEELMAEKGQKIDKEEFKKEFEKHQEKSRTAGRGMFKGGLGGHSETEIKYHTATHLLHQALRDVLGDHVHQAGSNINSDRLRFDFTHPTKLTEEEIKKVENEINSKVDEDLKVIREEMPKEEALKKGALAFFPERYPDMTSVYTIGEVDKPYSMELCGGSHVTSTGVIGRVRIKKQEKIGAGLVRIYLAIA